MENDSQSPPSDQKEAAQSADFATDAPNDFDDVSVSPLPSGGDSPTKNLLQSFSVPLAIVLAGAFIGAGIYFGNIGKIPNGGQANLGAPSAVPSAPDGGTGASGSAAQPVDVSADDDPFLGNANAPVTIIEFSDFQCPFCRRSFTDMLPQLKEKYIDTGKVKFVYRDFPLSFHAGAQPAAEGAECAEDQDKFWEMHDAIFEEQQKQGSGTISLTKEDIKKWAATVSGLNLQQWSQCLDSGKYKAEVEKDFADGQAAGVSGTPTFFINGRILVGAQPFSEFEDTIEAELTE